MSSIPIYLLEEHHECFMALHHFRSQQRSRRHLAIIHFDEHADLEQPILGAPIPTADAPLNCVIDFTYSQLSIGAFIYPALYQGGITDFVWVKPETNTATLQAASPRSVGAPLVLHIFSQHGLRTIIGVTRNIDAAGVLNSDRKSVRFHCSTLDSIPLLCDTTGLFIDIDFDYFSCSSELGGSWDIEITKSAYDEYRTNPYNRARLLFGRPDRRLRAVGDKYYFLVQHSDAHFIKNTRRNRTEIASRVDAAAAWIAKRRSSIVAVSICKSKISGFTPSEDVDFIASSLLDRLGQIFSFDPISVARMRTESATIDQTQGARPTVFSTAVTTIGTQDKQAVSDLVRHVQNDPAAQVSLRGVDHAEFLLAAAAMAASCGFPLSSDALRAAARESELASKRYFVDEWITSHVDWPFE